MRWHVITGEYPPQPGGVSDYTRQLVLGLAAAGDQVDVWAPRCGDPREPAAGDAGVTVHRLPDVFGVRSLWRLTRALDRCPAPRRILIQYVPQAFGWSGANVPFCLWLRSRRRDSIWVMFHEVMFRAEGDTRLSRRALESANRLMAALVAGAAERAFVSIPAWRPLVEPLIRRGASVTWLPVPSGLPVATDAAATAAIRLQYGGDRPLVGHFGTYGRQIRTLLERTLDELTVMSDCHVLLIGDRSDEACRALIAARPTLKGRLFATGRLAASAVSHHLSACDVMLQPYPDGISSRRTSAMTALSHGRAMVTTVGRLTEPIWADSGAAVLAPAADPHAVAVATATLLFDVGQRDEIGRRAATLYEARFATRHTVAALRGAVPVRRLLAVS